MVGPAVEGQFGPGDLDAEDAAVGDGPFLHLEREGVGREGGEREGGQGEGGQSHGVNPLPEAGPKQD